MENINIDKIISECIFDSDTKVNPLDTTIQVIEYCKTLESKLDCDKLLKLLCVIDCLYKAIGLMKIVSGQSKYNLCDVEIEKYINCLFTNKKIYKKIKEIKNANPTNLIDMIYKNFFEGKNENVQKICLEMNKLKNKIGNTLNNNITLEANSALKETFPNLPQSFLASNEFCLTLQKKIKDAFVRKQIEDSNNSKSFGVLDDFAILLLYRHKYANLLGATSYFDYVKQKGSVDLIKNLINDLLTKIEQRSRKETERLKRELLSGGFNKKVDRSDFVYYCEKFRPVYLFKPVDVIKVMFEISEKLFGLVFKPAKFALKLWSDKIMTCKVMGIAKEDLGYVHFDLHKTSTKKINKPLCMKLSGSPKRICLITSYSDINTRCMTYSDILALFREFGCVLQMITHDKHELIVKNDEFDVLMSQVMEYVVWEKSIVEKICVGLEPIAVEHIMFMRYVNFASSIKTKCVNSLFDHIIHNSDDLIDLIKQNIINKLDSGEIIMNLYKKIHNDIWALQSDIVNLDIKTISPDIILNEINGNESTLYCNILTEILSFAVYTLIKNGHGKEFVKDVLSQPSHELRPSLNQFIGKLKSDSYYLYLQEVVGYQEIDTELNTKTKEKIKNTHQVLTETSGNYFDDGENDNCDNYEDSSSSESDHDKIVVLERFSKK